MHSEFDWSIFIPPTLIATIASWFFYRRYGGLARGAAWLAWIGTQIIVAWVVVPRIRGAESVPYQMISGYAWATFCAALFCWLAGPFVVRLWGKWVDGRVADAEREPGAAAWRAWLAGRHVIYAILLAVLASQAWNFSLVLGILVFGGALAIYPAVLAVGRAPVSAAPAPAPARPISAEREKVMDLLSAGKITAEESTELLNALGAAATRESPRPAPLDSPQRFMLIGAALVLLGFFLPWFVMDLGRDLEHAYGQFAVSLGELEKGLPGGGNIPGNVLPAINGLPTGAMTVHLSGGDIRHGLGWAALLLGLVGALSHYVVRGLDAATLHAVRLGALAVGSLIIVYLLSENLRYVSFGLAIAIVGYVLEWIGILRQPRLMEPVSQAGV